MSNGARCWTMTDVASDLEEDVFADVEGVDTWAEELADDAERGAQGENSSYEEESLEQALNTLKRQKEQELPPVVRPTITKVPEVVDDFIRNFLINKGLKETLATFENEWYDLQAQQEREGVPGSEVVVPDSYLHNASLEERVSLLSNEVTQLRSTHGALEEKFENVRKQRDFHKLSHNRVMQEKSKLVKDITRLHQHNQAMEPMLQELRTKNESVMKERMLIRLERDKLQAKVKSLEDVVSKLEGVPKGTGVKPSTEKKKRKDAATWPPDVRTTNRSPVAPPSNLGSMSCRTVLKGHSMSVSAVSIHPTKPVVATASDDTTWRVWSAPAGDLIMSGDGHTDWVSGVSFNPRGTHIATSCGDGKVKVWDIMKASCSHTFTEHTQSAWDVAWHDQGEFLASCSLDHTAKIWDTTAGKLRQTLRGHVDSVNSVQFKACSNMVVTTSGDKTVSLWDPRTGFCVHTFYGHTNAVNSAAFSNDGHAVASVDADGMVVCHTYPPPLLPSTPHHHLIHLTASFSSRTACLGHEGHL